MHHWKRKEVGSAEIKDKTKTFKKYTSINFVITKRVVYLQTQLGSAEV